MRMMKAWLGVRGGGSWEAKTEGDCRPDTYLNEKDENGVFRIVDAGVAMVEYTGLLRSS